MSNFPLSKFFLFMPIFWGCQSKTADEIPSIQLDRAPFPDGSDAFDDEISLDIYFTRPESLENPLLVDALAALIDATTTSLDMSLYEFNHPHVLEAALNAWDRGVDIRMVGDGDEVHDEGYEALADVGVPIVMRKPRDRIMHNKFIIADQQAVWTGSTNVTQNGIMRNNNNGLLILSSDLAAHYGAEFNQMFEEALFGRKKEDVNGTNQIMLRDHPVDFYFSPEHDPIHDLIQLVDSAEESIYFMIFAYTHPDLYDAMVRAYRRGVDIVGVFDKSQARGRYSKDEALASFGIPVYIDGNENTSGFAGGKLHHKVMIIDGRSESPKVVSGSFNWSKSATRYNDENLIVFYEQAIAERYFEEFCYILSKANIHSEYAGQIPQPCADMSDYIIINEFLANPSGSDRGQEFIELINTGPVTIDLEGWTLGDAINPERHIFENTLLGAGEALVIFDRGDHSEIENAINASSTRLSLTNTGDKLGLRDAEGTLIDSVEYGTSMMGVSWNRSPDAQKDAEWQYHNNLSTDPFSPGSKADGSSFEEEEVQLIINEFFPNPDGTDTGNEFIEIINIGQVEASLNGWSLGDLGRKNRHVFDTEVLQPGEAMVVFDRGDHEDIPNAINSSSGTLSLTNSGDMVVLYDRLGEVHDQVSYDSCEVGVSLNRKPDGVAGSPWSNHDEVSAAQLSFSPGLTAEGEVFSSGE